MFGVEAPNYAHFIDDTIYTPIVTNTRFSKDGNMTVTNIPVKGCSEAQLPTNPDVNLYFNSASGSPVNDLYCIKKGMDDIFSIEGSFDIALYVYIDVNIRICQNSTNPNDPICKPLEVIDEQMSGYFAFYTMDYLLDPNNYENPGQPVGKDYFSPISVGVTRNTNRYIATSIVNSNAGFLISSTKTQTYPTYKEDKETFLLDNTNSGFVMEFRLRKYHNDLVYDRTYKRFEKVLAEMGGFIQMIYLIFFIMTYPFVSKGYFEKLINTIYNFEIAENMNFHKNSKKIVSSTSKYLDNNNNEADKERQRNSIEKNRFSTSKINKLEPFTIITSIKKMEKKASNKDMKESLKKNERLVKYMVKLQNTPPLKTSFWEYVKGTMQYMMKKAFNEDEKGFKFKQLQLGKSAISEKLDISSILKKFYEIDKLKMLLLDQDQYNLFEYLPKPVILKNHKIDLSYNSSDRQQKKFKFISYEHDVIAKAKKMYSAYQNISKKNELSEMDQKLINLMDDNIKEMLKVKIYLFVFLEISFFFREKIVKIYCFIRQL